MAAHKETTPLARARAERDLTQHQLAQRSGVSRAAVARLEADRAARPRLLTAAALAAAVGHPIAELFPGLMNEDPHAP